MTSVEATPTSGETETPVVFLHGIARTWRSMAGLRRHVAQAGYPTWARTYPSRRQPLKSLANEVAGRIREAFGDQPVWGVTHSMGGIIVRHMSDLVNWRGLVMIAPPNRGSRVARAMSDNPLFKWYYGPAGQEMAAPEDWPDPPTPCGVIAGTKHLAVTNPTSWLTRSLEVFPPDEPSDGTVSAWETRLDAMTSYAEVPASHTWLMNHPRTKALVMDFLQTGAFGDS